MRLNLADLPGEKVAIVIPTYNERDNISLLIKEVFSIIPSADIVVVDDSSPDGTGLLVDELAREYPRLHPIHRKKKQGLALAYIEGFRFVLKNLNSDFVFEMDADLSHNPKYIPGFLHWAQTNDLVIGSRFLRKEFIKERKIWRNLVSQFTRHIFNFFIGIRLSDVTTGFKCFRRSLLEQIDFSKIYSKGYAFQLELSYLAVNLGASIKEVPILFVERTKGESKINLSIMFEGAWIIFCLAMIKMFRVDFLKAKAYPQRYFHEKNKNCKNYRQA